jgi:hypothetical protein
VIDTEAGAALAIGRTTLASRQTNLACIACIAFHGSVVVHRAARSGDIDWIRAVEHTTGTTGGNATAAPTGHRRVGHGAAVTPVEDRRAREIDAA